MSGAGRSAAADVLEDLGFFVIDNLPPALIAQGGRAGARRASGPQRFGLVVDVRSGEFVDDLDAALAELREQGARTRVLFLDASDDVLVRRFEATRRTHPLAADDRVSEGIAAGARAARRAQGRGRRRRRHLRRSTCTSCATGCVELFDDERPRRRRCRPASCPSGTSTGCRSTSTSCSTAGSCRTRTGSRSCARSPAPTRRCATTCSRSRTRRPFLDELERLFALLLPAYVREGKSYLSIGVGCTGGRHRSVVIAAELGRIARAARRIRRACTTGTSSVTDGSTADGPGGRRARRRARARRSTLRAVRQLRGRRSPRW